jgi:enoyl-CoA hydratase
MPNYDELLFEVRDEIGYLTINRPQRLNALTRTTKQELRTFFDRANDRRDFKAIILAGAGGKSFCAGTDLNDMGGLDSVEGEQMLWLEHRMHDAIRRCNKPIISAINGYAVGGGCLVAITTDYSIAATNSTLGFPEIKAGVPSAIEIALLPRLVGLAKTREMVFFGEMINAQEALAIGLVNQVVPPDQVLATAEAVARKFIAQSPTALRLQKEIINKWIETDFVSAVESSIYASGLAFATGEPRAAIQKFLDKSRR